MLIRNLLEYILETTLNPFPLENGVISRMDFFAVSFAVDMSNVAKQSFCLLTSLELVHIPNCNSLYLHSNNMNS